MPRPRKPAPVIPTNSMVASAVRYPGKAARVYQTSKEWQAECYRHYDICGEARFAARFFGHALSRAVLSAGTVEGGVKVRQETGPAVAAINDLFNGSEGQEQMLELIGIHFTVAGECYLVGRKDEAGVEIWEIVSVLEMKVVGKKWSISYGNGLPDVPLEDDDVVIRLWMPSPARRIDADSPFRALLPILTEIEWLTKHIFAQTQSRLAGAGVWPLPDTISFPSPPGEQGQEIEGNETDQFMNVLGNAIMTPIEDPGSPASLVPTIIQVPTEALAFIKEPIHFWSPMDEAAGTMRAEAITRFAVGMDLPPEQVLGMSSNAGSGGGTSNGVSHWGAWQIEESTIKMFVEPMLGTICNSLAIGYLRPITENPTDCIVYDTSALRLRPDRSKESIELYNMGAISLPAMLRENGFDDEDMPTPKEFQDWLTKKVATGSATPEMVDAALKKFGVDLGLPPADLGTQNNETRPDPSIEDHPTRREPDAAALTAACDALVFRAMERAGNRLRSAQSGSRPSGVPAYETHVWVSGAGRTTMLLDDAWSCAAQVLKGLTPDPTATIESLNAYCTMLIEKQQKHDRAAMAQWLHLGDAA